MSGQLHAPPSLPGERAPGTHRLAGSVGPRAGLVSVQNYYNEAKLVATFYSSSSFQSLGTVPYSYHSHFQENRLSII
jgi:hypothetical protein